MPNLQELLPFFQALFQEWYLFTLRNIPYALTLALSVWLLTAIAYSFSIAWLKRRGAIETRARIAAETTLAETQQQLLSLREELNATMAKLDQATQLTEVKIHRANDLEQKLLNSNKQLVTGFSTLVSAFEIIENLPTHATVDSEMLWQRCHAIIERIAERFRGEQQAKARLQLDVQVEKSKLADKENLINSLQTRLDSQTEQLAQFDRVQAEQQGLRLELDSVKQQLNLAQEKNRNDSVRIADLEARAASAPLQTQPPIAEKPVHAEPIIVKAETIKISEPNVEPVPATMIAAKPVEVKPAPVIEVSQTLEAPVKVEPAQQSKEVDKTAVAAVPAAKGKWKGVFGNAMQQFSKLDEKFGGPKTPVAEPEPSDESHQEPENQTLTQQEVVVGGNENSASVSEEKPSSAVSGKLSGLFGGKKKTPVKETLQSAVMSSEEAASESVVAETKPAGKLGGLLGKFKKG